MNGAGPEQRRRVSGVWVDGRVAEVRRGEGEMGGGEKGEKEGGVGVLLLRIPEYGRTGEGSGRRTKGRKDSGGVSEAIQTPNRPSPACASFI